MSRASLAKSAVSIVSAIAAGVGLVLLAIFAVTMLGKIRTDFPFGLGVLLCLLGGIGGLCTRKQPSSKFAVAGGLGGVLAYLVVVVYLYAVYAGA